MKILTSPDSPQKALLSPANREEQHAILEGLTAVDYLRNQSRLLFRKAVGRPPELSLSREALDTLVGSIFYDADPNQEAVKEVYDGVTEYLVSTRPAASSSFNPVNPHTA